MTDIEGIIPPMLTPFDEEGAIAEDRLRDHVDFLVDSGVHGLFPGASVGELTNMNTDELETVTEITVDQAEGECPVYAGVGASGTKEAVERTRRASEAGVDGVVAVTPFYLETDQEGLRTHFSRIAAVADVPVILYHIPGFTGQPLAVDTVVSIAESEENVVGIKDSSGELMWGARILRNSPDTFDYLQGHGPLFLPSLSLGASGVMPATANIAPEFVLDVYESFENGDLERAREIQLERVLPLQQTAMVGTFPAGFKAAARMTGHDLGFVRSPAHGLTDSERESIRSGLESLGLLE
ncbi:MAG: dihydrodipicolinate synthase family protein [Halodesulfurarchaeum sp.]